MLFVLKKFNVTNVSLPSIYPNDEAVKEHVLGQPNEKHLFIARAFSAADEKILTLVIFSTFVEWGSNTYT